MRIRHESVHEFFKTSTTGREKKNEYMETSGEGKV